MTDELEVGSGDFETGDSFPGDSFPLPEGEPLPGGRGDHASHLIGLQAQTAGYDRERAICEARKAELDFKQAELEFDQAKKPRWTRVGWWLSAIATVAGIGGVGVQWTHSTRDLQLAEIQRERAELAQERAEQAAEDALALWGNYQEQIGEAQETLESLKQEQGEVQLLIDHGLELLEGYASLPEAARPPGVMQVSEVLSELNVKRAGVQAQLLIQQQHFDLEPPPQVKALEVWANRRMRKDD